MPANGFKNADYDNVYLPTHTVGVCLNVKKCKNGVKPPYKVDLGDGYCVDCYDSGRARSYKINNSYEYYKYR